MDSLLLTKETIGFTTGSRERNSATMVEKGDIFSSKDLSESKSIKPLTSVRMNPINGDIYLLLEPYSMIKINILYSDLNSSALSFYNYPNKEEFSMIIDKDLFEKIINLFNILGKDLFDKLSLDDLILMAKTAGAIDLGESVSIDRMYSYLDQD